VRDEDARSADAVTNAFALHERRRRIRDLLLALAAPTMV